MVMWPALLLETNGPRHPNYLKEMTMSGCEVERKACASSKGVKVFSTSEAGAEMLCPPLVS